jgi:hypothetical protein
MIVEMRTYSLVPGSLGTWLSLYEERGLRIHKEILGNLIGYFTSEFGDINEIVHIWGYVSLDDRDRRRAILSGNEEWRAFLNSALPLIRTQQIRILKGTSFSPIR